MSIGAVVLAAGLSARTPGNKLLLPFAGTPLIRHAVGAALASRAEPVVVVVGYEVAGMVAALDGLNVGIAVNHDFSKGLSASLKCGLKNLPPACEGAVILLGDMPLVRASLIDALVGAHEPGRICVPVRNGRRGNPVLWSKDYFPDLLALEGDAGAKRLLAVHQDAVVALETADDGPFIDIDTAEDLRHYEER